MVIAYPTSEIISTPYEERKEKTGYSISSVSTYHFNTKQSVSFLGEMELLKP